jgi:hypothetical protein
MKIRVRSQAVAGLSLLAVLASCAGTARAKDAPTAEALFRAGREASKRGDTATACERFGESYRLDPAVGTLLNLATCQEELHRLADAWESYRHVADSLPRDDDRRPMVRERIAAIDARLPRVTIETTSTGTGQEITSDGTVLKRAAINVPLPMDPGEHHFVVRAQRRQTREYVLFLHEGDRVKLRVEPGDAVQTPPALPTQSGSQPAKPSLQARAADALFGAGVFGLITAGITAGFYLSASATVDDACNTSTNTCSDEGLRAAGAAEHLQTTMYITGAIGLAALAGAVTLWTIGSTDPKKPAHAVFIGPGTIGARMTF